MSDNFDDILKHKLEQSFQDLEIPYEPDHWNELKSRMESRNVPLIFRTGFLKVAAAILLAGILGLYLALQGPEKTDTIAENESPATDQSLTNRVPPDPVPNPDESDTSDEPDLSDEPEMDILERTVEDPPSEELVTNATDATRGSAEHSLFRMSVPTVYLSESFLGSNLEVLPVTVSPASGTLSPVVDDMPSQPLEYSVMASSVIGFSEAEEGAPLGFSAGFSSAYQVSPSFSVSSGLALSHQNMQIENMGGEVTAESDPGEIQYLTQAKLLALDIPLNLRYHIATTGPSRSFISIGLSSLLYLQQNFTYTARFITEVASESEDGSVIITRNVSEQQSTSSRPAFSGFEAARMLNVSVGIHYSLSSGSDLVIEPYLKYPLGSLTSRDVYYGSGGLQVRFVFSRSLFN